MKSDGYTEPVLPFTTLRKLALPLAGHYSKKVGPCTQERGQLSLTRGEDEPTLRTGM